MINGELSDPFTIKVKDLYIRVYTRIAVEL